MEIIIYVLSILAAYLIGSISPSILISKLKGKNIMKEGSGNAGATNAIRVLGIKLGLCVFALDVIKGFIIAFVPLMLYGETLSSCCALAVVVGHTFSIFHKFKAGKGVAPTIGAVLAIDWRISLLCVVFGLVLVVFTKRVSIGSISAAIVFPVSSYFLHFSFLYFSIALAVLVIFNHRSNIVRLFKGKEQPLNVFTKKNCNKK